MLATNTSTLDIDEIAGATSRPQNIVGLHFFSPANVMRLLEVVRGKDTRAEIIATALAIAKKLKKVGVVVGNCHGFVGNRMFLPYMREAQFLVEEGATPTGGGYGSTTGAWRWGFSLWTTWPASMSDGAFAKSTSTMKNPVCALHSYSTNYTRPGRTRAPQRSLQTRLVSL